MVAIHCPTCGLVEVSADAFDYGKPVSAICPKCEARQNRGAPEVRSHGEETDNETD